MYEGQSTKDEGSTVSLRRSAPTAASVVGLFLGFHDDRGARAGTGCHCPLRPTIGDFKIEPGSDTLARDYADYGDRTPQLKERCLFALAALGLSISQLFGQNDPNPAEKVRYPTEILSAFIKAHGLDPTLGDRFKGFNYFYNGCRHFGKTTSGKRHRSAHVPYHLICAAPEVIFDSRLVLPTSVIQSNRLSPHEQKRDSAPVPISDGSNSLRLVLHLEGIYVARYLCAQSTSGVSSGDA